MILAMTCGKRNAGGLGLLLSLIFPLLVLLGLDVLYPPEMAHGLLGVQWADLALGCLALVCIAAMLPLIRNQYRTIRGYMLILPCLFVMIALVNPDVLYFSLYHLAGLALCAASVYYLRFLTREKRLSDLFLAVFCLSAGAVAVPYLQWLVLPLLVLHGKQFLYVLTGMLLPWLYHFSWNYLVSDQDPMSWAGGVFSALIAVKQQWFSMSLLQWIVLVLLVLIAALAVLYLFRKERALLRPVQWQAVLAVLYAAVLTGVLVMIFESSFLNCWQLLPLIPTSLIIFDYLHDRCSDHEGRLLVILLVGSVLVLRISQLM